MKSPLPCLALAPPLTMSAAEHRVNSPDGRLAFVVSDDAGLRYRVELDGRSLLDVESTGAGEAAAGRVFGLVAHVYDDGMAFRHELPAGFGAEEFTLTRELPEFRFTVDHRCWAGGEAYAVERSTDLVTWTVVSNHTVASPEATFTEAQTQSQAARRFYRARQTGDAP
jgi:hypothetical protein